MRDRDVRDVLRAALAAEHTNDDRTVIIEELGVCERSARIDLAVINGALAGFEIKSERDTLDRLPAQAQFYSRVFDTVTVVTHRAHLPGVRATVPFWWGITEARKVGNSIQLRPLRRARENPQVDAYSLAQLLWREEALVALEVRKAADGVRSKKREALWARLVETVPLMDLADLVRETLKTRPGWRGRAPQM